MRPQSEGRRPESGGRRPESERTRRPESEGVSADGRRGAVDLVDWLEARASRLVELWIHEIRARGLGRGTGADRVVEMFAHQLIDLLPVMIGPYRDQVQTLWDRGSELYGAMAAKRGLAAGEAIEELHILRELIIRELYRDPPSRQSVPLSLREFLRLSRSLDRAVTYTSVGHTDALFFQFFEADGAGPALLSGEDVAEEAEAQFEGMREEMRMILQDAPWNGRGGDTEGRPGETGN